MTRLEVDPTRPDPLTPYTYVYMPRFFFKKKIPTMLITRLYFTNYRTK
jgi:hypothetical protein